MSGLVIKIPTGWSEDKVVTFIRLMTELAEHNPKFEGFDIAPLTLASGHTEYKSAFDAYRAQCREQYGSVAAAILATAPSSVNSERQTQP